MGDHGRKPAPVRVVGAAILLLLVAAGCGSHASGHPTAAATQPSTTTTTVPATTPTSRSHRPAHGKNHRLTNAKKPRKPRAHSLAMIQCRRSLVCHTVILQALRADVPTYAAPNGKVTGHVSPTTELGSLWVPVEAQRGRWVRIGMPGPPNGESGWVRLSAFRQETSRWFVTVSLSQRKETVYHSGKKVAEAAVAVGAPDTPTPTGHTFIDGDLSTNGPYAVEAPVLRPVALNSTSKLAATEIGGTLVALHGWENLSSDPSVFGQAVSHGCVRAPAGPLTKALQQVPTGSPVWITA